MKKEVKKLIAYGLALILVLLIGSNTFTVIEPSERGVLITLGEVTGGILEPGMHFHTPFISRIQKYSIVPKGLNVTFSVGADGAITKDMQTVGSQVSVFFRYSEGRILEAITKYSDSILESAITRSLISCVKESVGKYSIYDLVESQDKINADVTSSMNDRLKDYPIEITQLTISNWDWSDDFDKQIKETMNRTQQVRQAEQDLKLAETNSQKQIAEAEAQKKAAEQKAEADLIKAQKAAEAKKVEADALAYYNGKVAQNYNVEIKLKELEIELERAKKWDGKQVPTYVPITAAGTIVDLPKAD